MTIPFILHEGAIKDGRDRVRDVLNQLERKRENTFNLCAQVLEDSYLHQQQSRRYGVSIKVQVRF